MHTDTTIASFHLATADVGKAFRRFADDTASFHTVELPRERANRVRQDICQDIHRSTGLKWRMFNNSTAKTHSLGDFVWSIKYFGTTDSTNTSTVSLCIYFSNMSLVISIFIQGENQHKRAKSYYQQVGKDKHVGQIAQHER